MTVMQRANATVFLYGCVAAFALCAVLSGICRYYGADGWSDVLLGGVLLSMIGAVGVGLALMDDEPERCVCCRQTEAGMRETPIGFVCNGCVQKRHRALKGVA